MKKLSILLFTIPGFYFAQLAAPQGQMLATEKPNTGFVGIGTTNPISNLEIASPTATLTLSTNQASGTAENPLYPKIDFLGYANWPKARITAAEQTYNTHGSKLSFFVNDGTGATSLKEMMTINQDSNVGIGTTNPQAKLDVNGKISIASGYPIQLAGNQPYHGIQYSNNGFANTFVDGPVIYGWSGGGLGIKREVGESLALKWNAAGNVAVTNKLEAKEIKVTTTPTADFVFEDSYQLPDLESVEKHIKEKKHLPEIASAAEMQKDGVNIGDFQIKLLQKIEELTLYQIQLNKEVTNLKQENIQLKETLQKIQNHEKSY
ncbi:MULTISPECIES: hypothetical protein [Elizabethkingia]|uniref:hypothetical protein n=1 Tax=Elizabethkingia TaxID=308865 RepID=UPI0012B2A6FA|nr:MULTISPECIES: hypothetical protein [Elizabethkingia]MCT3670246.1 hypothetical protein [Elizabethkingia anophelis]MCT3688134.1 hypothetical protein [Elizabethkingia anophelis]MCT3707063.1 hypothetical protein [Elizabethkingia anophelis]MCT3713738.1 hypothetical protein [Elizabethkingia anophelis]MCT3717157.1 hypothetical protein [Elizabethkingia anophelis]